VANLTAAEWTKFWDTGRGPLVPHARAAVLIALSLMAIGVLMVYSASSTRAGIAYQDSEFFLWRQLTWALLGLATLFLTMRANHRNLEQWARPALIVSLVLLAAVLVPGFGHSTKGAQRWFRVGPMSLQPSELVKLTIVVWLALHLSRASDRLADWKRGILPAAGPLAIAALLVIVEPDLGTALFLAAVGAAMMLVGGERCETLERAVDAAAAAARPGEVVLLSPACASFDQFEDYEARGRAFKEMVAARRT